MLASYGVLATAGSRLRTYGGDGGSSECRYELIRCTNVDFPAPAMPIVMMTTGFFLSCTVAFSVVEEELASDFSEFILTAGRWWKKVEIDHYSLALGAAR